MAGLATIKKERQSKKSAIWFKRKLNSFLAIVRYYRQVKCY